MRIFRGTDNIPDFGDTVVAVGAFDGVHLGHRRILQFLHDEARKKNATAVVLTFDPHPKTVLCNDDDFFAINTLEENLELIGQQNIDYVVIQPFTKAFSKTSYKDFLSDVIIGKLHAKALVMGPNHSMGHNREGNNGNLKNEESLKNIDIVEIPEEIFNDAGVHSALIRDLIRQKDWGNVDKLLGYEYKHKEE